MRVRVERCGTECDCRGGADPIADVAERFIQRADELLGILCVEESASAVVCRVAQVVDPCGVLLGAGPGEWVWPGERYGRIGRHRGQVAHHTERHSVSHHVLMLCFVDARNGRHVVRERRLNIALVVVHRDIAQRVGLSGCVGAAVECCVVVAVGVAVVVEASVIASIGHDDGEVLLAASPIGR